MSSDLKKELPGHVRRVAQRMPDVWAAYEKLGQACAEAGPLTGTAIRQIKLALAIGAGSEGAVHSHVRRALAAGIEPDAVRQIGCLAITTLGFPRAMAALSWIEDVLSPSKGS